MNAQTRHAAHTLSPAPAPPAMTAAGRGVLAPRRRPAPATGEAAPMPRFTRSLAAVPAGARVQRKCTACEADDKAKVRRQPESVREDDDDERATVQARTEVGPAGDRYEREADAIAARVMAMPAPGGLDPSPAPDMAQRKCAACAGEEETRPRRAVSGPAATGAPSLAASPGTLTAGGRALPPATQGFFEARMGRDLSDVRVHEGGASASLNRSINARAFTYGQHVWLGAGERPEPSFTMAHELAHVMQQTAPGPLGPGPVAMAAPAAMTASGADPAIRRAEPATTSITFGAAVAKCVIGAIVGALFDAAIQAVLHSIKEWTWRFWRATWDYCSIILSAVLGCIAAPISAAILDPWVTAKLGPRLGGMAGTLLGKVLLFIAKKLAIGIPKGIVKQLAKLGCISPEQAAELGVKQGPGEAPEPDEPIPDEDGPGPRGTEQTCDSQSGDIQGHERVLMRVNTTELLTREEGAKLDRFADSIRGSRDRIAVHGLASVDGPKAYNERLSCARAHAGRRGLERRGVSASRITRVVKHGEVPGPKDWQRSVVFELIPPEPTRPAEPTEPEPGGERPTPGGGGAGPGTVQPRITLRAITFGSDHGVLKDNRDSWTASGRRFKEPEWRADRPDEGVAPITHDKGQRILATAEVDVAPKSAPATPVRLRGFGPSEALSFEGATTLKGGDGQKVQVAGQQALPDAIGAHTNQTVTWAAELGGKNMLLTTTFGHDVFATYGKPVSDTTYKRVDMAVRLTQGFGNNPHDILSNQLKRFPEYNLDNPIRGNIWVLADDIPAFGGEGADCQSIVRFILAVNKAVGIPGEGKGIAVYADPEAPTVPKTAPLLPGGGSYGGMQNYPGYGLFDGNDNFNNYEAAAQFSTVGTAFFPEPWRVEKFYPGGVPGGRGLPSAKHVLYVFKQLATVMKIGDKSRPAETVWCYEKDREKC